LQISKKLRGQIIIFEKIEGSICNFYKIMGSNWKFEDQSAKIEKL